MSKLELFSNIFYISSIICLLYALYAIIRVRLFINKRYEKETKLSQSRYFTETAPWVKHIPPFFRSSVYLSHLLKFHWYEKKDRFAIKKRKAMGEIDFYNDIESPDQVTSHFSNKEIKLVKRAAYVLFLLILYVVAFYIFKLIWPETFISG